MAKETFTAFRALLRDAISDRTQAQFAIESNLSPEHLNRMLNANTIYRPNKQTLLKIASVARNGVTYQDMVRALNAEDGGEMLPRISSPTAELPFEERADLFFHTFCVFLKTSMPFPVIRPDVAGFLNEAVSLFHTVHREMLPLSYQVGETGEYHGKTRWELIPCSYTRVTLSTANWKYAATSELILYHVPVGDQVAIRYASMATDDVFDVCGRNSDKRANSQPYHVQITAVPKFRENYEAADPLDAALGQCFEHPVTIEGFGFWLPNVPAGFADFVRNHLGVVLDGYEGSKRDELEHGITSVLDDASDDVSDKLGQVRTSSDKLAAFLDGFGYDDYLGLEDGWGAAISNVMSAETGFSFTYLVPERRTDFAPRSDTPCVLMTAEDKSRDNVSRETLVSLICKYARELGIVQFGDLFFHTLETKFRKMRTYFIDGDGNPRVV